MSKTKPDAPFKPLNLVILTISDRRTLADDEAGHYLAAEATAAGHRILDHRVERADRQQVEGLVTSWIADSEIQVVLVVGGTGLTADDIASAAIQPLIETDVPGFGELFRHLSYAEIGTSCLQSRAFAGLAKGTLIVAMPSSPGGCRTAWDGIIRLQIDSRTRPCNFVGLLKSR